MLDISKADKKTQDEVIEEIHKVLKIADKYESFCFGEFVLNVLIPREADPNCQVFFEYLCICFQHKEDISNFNADLAKLGYNNAIISKFGIELFRVCSYEPKELVITDVAHVVYTEGVYRYIQVDYEANKFTFIDDENTNKIIETLKVKIIKKQATVDQRLIDILIKRKNIDGLFHNFIRKSWIIELPNGNKTDPSLNDLNGIQYYGYFVGLAKQVKDTSKKDDIVVALKVLTGLIEKL